MSVILVGSVEVCRWRMSCVCQCLCPLWPDGRLHGLCLFTNNPLETPKNCYGGS